MHNREKLPVKDSRDTAGWRVCHAFLQHTSPDKREVLVSFLTQSDKEKLSSLPSSYHGNPALGWDFAQEVIPQVHYSWFMPFLRTLSHQDLVLFLASLSESQAKGLKKALLFSNQNSVPTLSLSSVAKSFLHKKLLAPLTEEGVLPLTCLPASPLNNLLLLDFSSLLRLINCLGMHDLSLEIKQIIETSKLKQIYASLTQEQSNYLKIIQTKKEPVVFARMALNKWNGDKESLQGAIHQRGLNRLAKALNRQDPNMIWHLCHKLDATRGASLHKLCTPEKELPAAAGHSEMTTLLIEQVEAVFHYLQNHNPPTHS